MQKGLPETSHEVEERGDDHAPEECTWEGEERGREAASPHGERAALAFSSECKSRDTSRDKLEKPTEKLLDTFLTPQ